MQRFYAMGHICYGIMTGVSQMEHEVCAFVSVSLRVCVRMRALVLAGVVWRGD